MRESLKHFPESREQIDTVYGQYNDQVIHPRLTMAAYHLMGIALKHHITHQNPEAITEHLNNNGVLVMGSNHYSAFDPFGFAGSVSRDPVLKRIGYNGRAIAKIPLFRNRAKGWFISFAGGIPGVRQEDDSSELGDYARMRQVETSTELVARGQHHLVFIQGTRRREGDPYILSGKPKTGIGRIATGAAQLIAESDEPYPSSVAVLPQASAYPKGRRHGEIYTGELIHVTADMDPYDLTSIAAEGIQSCLDHLREQHAA